MTIIESHKSSLLQGVLLYLAGAACLLMIAGISLYNMNVSLKYQVSVQEKQAQQLEATNADMQNKLYTMLDAQNLTAVAAKDNLVQDTNPNYLAYTMLAHR
ncbi:hypothetical protein KGO95_02570 [Patescibacteria group bacterium]|nr:hypothetical protein [Patescibacteria group bacterium]